MREFPAVLQTVISVLAAGYSENPALLAPQRSSTSYGKLCAHITSVARCLNAAGIHRGDRVAIVVPNGPEMAAAFFAVTSVATCAPLNPAYRAAEFDYYLGDLQPKAIILHGVETELRGLAQSRGIRIIDLNVSANEPAGLFELDLPLPVNALEPEWSAPDDVALLLHTSGTTSRPKLVPLTQSNLCLSASNIQKTLGLTVSDRCLNVMPLFHIHGLVGAILSSITAGASIVCAPAFSAPRFFEWLNETAPTWYTAVPTIHQALLARVSSHAETVGRSSLRFIRSSSAPLAPRVMEELERVFNVPVIESYGMTEAAHQMASNPLPPGKRKPGSVGLPAGPEIAIMDESGIPLACDKVGDVVIRGRNVFSAYEGNTDANSSAFVNGWFRTGDLGRIDEDGYLFLVGRTKEIINRGGEKISPREVDDALMEHPSVRQAVTFALPDVRLGEVVGAAVVLHDHAKATEGELAGFVAERLADFKVPRRIVFLAELPKGPTGKLQRIGLAASLGLAGSAALAPASETDDGGIEENVWDRNAKRLARIWEEVLEIESVGLHDDFFSLGGSSLLAARLISEINAAFHLDLSLGILFEAPTVGQLAKSLRRGATRKFTSSLIPVKPSGSMRPMFLISRFSALGFHALSRHLEPEQPLFGLVPPGPDNGAAPISRVEDLARHYINEIRSVQSSGPYLIGGYSFGTFPAYEMACQLQEQGETVALLFLIDGGVHLLPRYVATLPKSLVWQYRLRHLWRALQFHAETAGLSSSWNQRFRYFVDLVETKQRALRRQIKWYDTEILPDAIRVVEQANRSAFRNYLPRKYPGNLTLVRSTRGFTGFDLGRHGWIELAAGMELHQVDGSTHLDILTGSNAARVAEILQLAIKKAERSEALAAYR